MKWEDSAHNLLETKALVKLNESPPVVVAVQMWLHELLMNNKNW